MTAPTGEAAPTETAPAPRPRPARRALDDLGLTVTAEDIQVMRETVVEIQDLLDGPPEEGLRDEQWRHSLMNLGHDPLNQR